MTRPDVVLQLGPPHDAIAMLREVLSTLRVQLREHGVAFVALSEDDPVHSLAPLLEAERTRTQPVRHGLCPTLVAAVSSGPDASSSGDPDGAGPYPDAVTIVRDVIESTASAHVRVILHIERQDRLMERAYHDAVLAGGSHEFADQFPHRHEPVLDFGPLVGQLEALPEVFEVRIRPVELAYADTRVFVDDVLDAVGLPGELDLTAVPPVPPVSRRLTSRGVRITAAMNAHLDDEDERAGVREFVLEHFAVPSGANAADHGILADTDRESIVQAYAAVNQELFAE